MGNLINTAGERSFAAEYKIMVPSAEGLEAVFVDRPVDPNTLSKQGFLYSNSIARMD